MHLHTLRRTLKTGILRVSPAKPNSGITLNGITACPQNVVRGDSCVVLHEGTNYAFVVEHPLSALRMCGIHDAFVEGTEDKWDFTRPQHRAAYAMMLKPSAVLGNPDGTVSGGIVELIDAKEILDSGVQRDEVTIVKDISVSTEDGGKLDIEPALKGTGLDIELCLAHLGPLKAKFDPETGLKPDELRIRVGKSVTAFIRGPTEDSLIHALGDLIGDLAGTAGIDDAVIRARLMRAYHRLTMDVARRIELTPAD